MFSRFIYSFITLFFAVFMIFAVPATSFADGHEGTVPEEPGGEDHPADEEAPPEEGEDGEEAPEEEDPKPEY